MEWKGIYAPLPTPFDEEGGLDLSALRRNLDAWARSPLDGLVLCGSNGELPFLEPQERVLVTRTVRDHLGDRFPLVVGAHLPTTRGTLDLADRLADAGADALLLLPPHYFKGDPEGIRRYFTDVADRSPLPVMLYNMPANTGVNLGTDLILSLAAHPRIPAVKDTGGDITQLTALCARRPEGFSVFCGSGNYYLPALAVGAQGGTLAVANLYPGACDALRRAFREGRTEETRDLQHRILGISEALTRRFGVPGLKALMDRKGLYGGPCRLPLRPADPESVRRILEADEEAQLEAWEAWRR